MTHLTGDVNASSITTTSAGAAIQTTGTPASVVQVLSQWMQSNQIHDVNQLTDGEVLTLIEDLRSAQNDATSQSGPNQRFDEFISQLLQILQLPAGGQGTSPVDSQLALMHRQLALGHAIASTTDQPDPVFNQSVSTLDSSTNALQDAVNQLFSATSGWASSTNSQSVQSATQLLAKLNGLASFGLNLQALGLSGVRDSIQNALNTYNTATESAKTDADRQMALSEFRIAVASAKIKYAQDNGISADSSVIKAQTSIINTEQIWQTNANMPWEKSSVPNPDDYTVAGLSAYKSELNTRYQMAIAAGDTILIRAIQAKLSLVDQAVQQKKTTNTMPELIAINTWLTLQNVDMATKSALMSKAQTIQDDAQRNQYTQQFSQDIDHINSLISSVTSQITTMGSYMAKLYDF